MTTMNNVIKITLSHVPGIAKSNKHHRHDHNKQCHQNDFDTAYLVLQKVISTTGISTVSNVIKMTVTHVPGITEINMRLRDNQNVQRQESGVDSALPLGGVSAAVARP